jgi:ferrous iron transport protein B
LFESLPDFAGNLLIDGILNGLGIVISFFPLIAIFFIFMSLIEDSGYMARAAFLLDRLMHSLGLDGKAFINILLGYGCNVPAVMGTRILSSRHNRIVTMLLIPFTLCSARFQVFVFLAAILFAPSVAPWVVFGLYVLSFVMVFVVGFILKLFKFAGKPEPFIMEIPPYRVPTVNTVALRAWMEMKSFLYTASTYIIGGVVLVWLLTNLPAGVEPGSINTWAGQIGQFLQPIFHPIGIGWREVIALIFGFVAKEIVVGSMAVIYGADTATQILASITPLQGISFMVFTLLYTPCIATIAAIKAESASWKITGISLVLGIAIAWVSAFIVYQGGLVLGFH